MKSKALRTAGVLFLIMAAAQAVRFTLKVHVVAGTTEIPVWVSAVAAAAFLGLSVWMFKAARD